MSNPGVKETLALLDALKDAVRNFAVREEKLAVESRSRTAAAAKLAEDAVADRTNRLADRIEKENVAYAEARTHRDAAYQNRKARINRAHSSAHRAIMAEIAGEQDEFKNRVHTGTQEAAQQRDAALAETVVVLENFRTKTAEAAQHLDLLATRVRSAFGGYGKFKRMLSLKPEPEPDLSPDEHQLFGQFGEMQRKVETGLADFQKILLPKIFRFLPLWLIVLLLVAIVAAVPVLQRFAVKAVSWPLAGVAAAVPALLLVIYFYGSRDGAPKAWIIAGNLARARRFLEAAAEKAESRYHQDQARIKENYEQAVRDINQEWRNAVRGALETRDVRPAKVDERARQIYERFDRLHRDRLKALDDRHAATTAQLRQESEDEERTFSAEHTAKTAALEADLQSQWQALEIEWKTTVLPLFEQIHAAKASAEKLFPEWQAVHWQNWRPPVDFKNAAQFARLEIDVAAFAEAAPRDQRFALPEPKLSVPLALTYPHQGSILFET
ncbi:MAG TPA: hypothetical protein VN625_06785, partial [Desulfuromonadaceae bacterium]|nr:hypothetical protein [Desulfuromonadaceae bacterium]